MARFENSSESGTPTRSQNSSGGSRRQWTNDEIEELITLVRKEKHLYDLTETDHKDIVKRMRTWDMIGRTLGFTEILESVVRRHLQESRNEPTADDIESSHQGESNQGEEFLDVPDP
ncbi:hypothetical protein MTO96_034682 [Rhipicephalus appendiculatus]